jgi:PKD repeat protein
MKKNLFSILTMMFLAVCFAQAQNPSNDCKLKADFAFKPDSCTVAFTDKSTAAAGITITGWSWNFGDGSSANTKDAKHVYSHSGRYEVCLTVVSKNSAGKECKDRSCHLVQVKGCGSIIDSAKCRLAAMFKTKTDSCTASFTDASSAGLGTTITKWFWTFGDGSVDSVNQNPTHTYMFSGHYAVCLTITGKNLLGKECKDKECRFVDIKGCAKDTTQCRLNAKFESKTDSCTVSFADNSMTAAGTTIHKWYWTFGDGSVDSVNQNPVHTYAHNGFYNVCLTIEGKNAASGKVCKDRECHSIMVKGCGNIIDSTKCRLKAMFKSKTDSCTATFADASSAGKGTTITKWYWTFGDGTVDSVNQNPTHTYAFSGHYIVCLTIVGNSLSGKECKDRECRFVDIKGCAKDTTQCRLNAKFESKTDSCTVTFTDKSMTTAGASITKWYWTFGDGTVDSVNQNPTHTYAHDGHYSVCLTVVGKNATSGKECKDRECHFVMVKGCAPDPTICRLNAKFDSKKDSTYVKFDDQSTATNGTSIVKWYWTFGDGGVDSVQNPVHVYAKDGRYNVCLIVVGINALGKECKDISCHQVVIGKGHKGIDGDFASSISSLQMFPNPATNVVNINFKVETAGQVNISVSDIQGRVLAVVQDGYLTSGFHNVQWNVGVHPGWYIVSIKTNAGVEQQQLLIQQQ